MVNSADFKEFLPIRADQEVIQNYLKKDKESANANWTYTESIKHVFSQTDLDKSKAKAISVLENHIVAHIKNRIMEMDEHQDHKLTAHHDKEIKKFAKSEAESILENLKKDNKFSKNSEINQIDSIASKIIHKERQGDFLA